MQETLLGQQDTAGKGEKTVAVNVNNHSVVFPERKVTGLKIKETAISQGVAISEDFNLFQVKHDGRLDPVSDDQTLELHEHDEFRAVAPDDNS